MKPPGLPPRLILILTAALATPLPSYASIRDLDEDGKPNTTDRDVDNDGLPNGRDLNIDGGVVRRGALKGRYVGDRLKNDDPAERDIDGDGLKDDSDAERDIDGDGRNDDLISEDDIDGDGRGDDSINEDDIDGDGRDDDSINEDDIDGDGRDDDSINEDDIDGDGRDDDSINEDDIDGDGLDDDSIDEDDIDGDGLDDDSIDEDDSDGDGRHDGIEDDDDDGDGLDDESDLDDDGDGTDDDDEIVAVPPGTVGDGSAPVALTGIDYEFSEGDDPQAEVLSFNSATEGEIAEGSEVDAFTYTHAPSGTTSVVTVVYEPGEFDEFNFNFETGGFLRKRFEGGVLKRTEAGNFALVL